jgi:hypothetical protein
MDENMFEQTVVTTAPAVSDDDIDSPVGASGPMYQLNFGKEYTRVLLDQSIKAEIPNATIRPEFKSRDYKVVVKMMDDLKTMALTEWQAKYFTA